MKLFLERNDRHGMRAFFAEQVKEAETKQLAATTAKIVKPEMKQSIEEVIKASCFAHDKLCPDKLLLINPSSFIKAMKRNSAEDPWDSDMEEDDEDRFAEVQDW